MSEAWPDTSDGGYIPTWTHSIFTSSSRNSEFKDTEYLSNHHKDYSNQHKNSHELCYEMGHPVLSTMKWGNLFWVCWKVIGGRHNNIRISQWSENHCTANTSIRRKKEIWKSRTVRVTVRDPSRKLNHLSKIIWEKNYNSSPGLSVSPE